jgi:hypothetical protein
MRSLMVTARVFPVCVLYTRLFPALSSFHSVSRFATNEWFTCSQFTPTSTPKAAALKSGIHRSIISTTSLRTGFLWNGRPQHRMFGGVPLRLV